jgi:hypothetical protein
MGNHKVELIARMAVLSGGIAHGDALRRHGHRLDVNGEPVGVAQVPVPVTKTTMTMADELGKKLMQVVYDMQ